MGKVGTLLAMAAGAAICYGVMNLKKQSASQPEPAAEPLDDELNELKKDAAGEDASWRASYTINGESVSAEEMKEKIREETSKAVENFRSDAKVVSEEILTGLKKAVADMKVAVDGARKAASERRAGQGETKNIECCDSMTDGECCCEGMKNAAENIKEKAEEIAQDVKDFT